MKEHHKQLKKDYQENPRPMGVFLIRNNLTDKIFLGSGLDIAGIINRHRFTLKHGSHQNKSLQADWNELGEANFAFEILDELTPRAGVALDHRAELAVMESSGWKNFSRSVNADTTNLRSQGRNG